MTETTSRALPDLRDRDDISLLMIEFYRRAFADPLLGPIFTDVAHMDLAAHLPVLCDFWETVLFRAGLYRGNAFNVHVTLHQQEPLTPKYFQRWLDIWEATVADLFTGPVAALAVVQAGRIAKGISQRLERTGNVEIEPPSTATVEHPARDAANDVRSG